MPMELVTIIGTIVGIVATAFLGHRWLVKAYLRELVPNGGSSLADRIRRVENRVDAIYDHLITNK